MEFTVRLDAASTLLYDIYEDLKSVDRGKAVRLGNIIKNLDTLAEEMEQAEGAMAGEHVSENDIDITGIANGYDGWTIPDNEEMGMHGNESFRYDVLDFGKNDFDDDQDEFETEEI